MVCLGLKPGTAGCKAQTNPLSIGDPPPLHYYIFCQHAFATFDKYTLRWSFRHSLASVSKAAFTLVRFKQ